MIEDPVSTLCYFDCIHCMGQKMLHFRCHIPLILKNSDDCIGHCVATSLIHDQKIVSQMIELLCF